MPQESPEAGEEPAHPAPAACEKEQPQEKTQEKPQEKPAAKQDEIPEKKEFIANIAPTEMEKKRAEKKTAAKKTTEKKTTEKKSTRKKKGEGE